MKLFRYIAIAAVIILISSCSIVRKTAYAPNWTQLNLSLEDLEYIGDTEISIEYSKYLGIFTKYEKVNGEIYNGLEQTYTSPSRGLPLLTPKLRKASYVLYDRFPNADYFIVTGTTVNKTKLFLGSEIEAKARIRAYKFKSR